MNKKSQIHHSPKERIEVATKICNLYATGEFTIESCCNNTGITDKTFNNWVSEFSEVSELYKQARAKSHLVYKKNLREKAKTSLQKLIEGYQYEETSEETGETSKGTFTKTVKKIIEVQPNPTLIQYVLNNTNDEEDPNFVHASKAEITGKNGEPLMTAVNVIMQQPNQPPITSESDMKAQNGITE